MANLQTGIHTGKSSIEVVQIKKTLTGYQLLNWGRKEISSSGLSPLEVSNLLKEVLKENRIEPVNVITSLPDSEVLLRYFNLPLLSPKERDSAIRFEAQKYIPFKMGEVASSYFTLPAREKKKELQVIFLATKRDLLNKHLEILKEANIEPEAVEVSSLTLMRLLRILNLLDGKNLSAIVHIEKDEAVITICDKDVPYLMRDFSLLPQEALSLDELKIKREEPTPYDILLREIQLSLDYHYKRFPSLTIERIILVGENSLENWKANLERDLKINTFIANPGIIFGKGVNLNSQSSTAVGLALRGFFPWDKKISLLEKEIPKVKKVEIPKEEKVVLTRTFLLGLFFSLVIMIFVHFLLSSQIRIIKDKLNQVRKVREKISKEWISSSKEELNKIYQEWNRKRNIFVNLLEKRLYLTPYWSELPRLLPEGLWFETMQIESKIDDNTGKKIVKLAIEGIAFSGKENKSEADLINEFVTNLKSSPIFSPEFKKVELGFMEKKTMGNFTVTHFRVNCSN